MKKILLTMVAFVFCIASAQAETPQYSNDSAAFISQSLANNVSVADILVKLPKDGVNLQDATVAKFIIADGNKLDTLAAALLVASSGEEALPGDKPADSSSSGHEEDQAGDAAADSSSSGDPKDKGKKHSEPGTLGSGSGASPS